MCSLRIARKRQSQEKHVDYQCLMPFAALSFDQHTKSLSKCQILGAERRSIIHIRS